MSIFLSCFDDPYINLALEKTLFYRFKLHGLFIWKNRSAVIIGRNQNPWQECAMKMMQQHEVSLCRRTSGGGSVFHDRGNINCSFFSHTSTFNRTTNLRFIQDALASLQIKLEYREPHDFLLKGCKVSGSAFRVEKNRALHHLTLLCESDIHLMWQVLRQNTPSWGARGTRSRVAEVGNIADVHQGITLSEIEQAIITAYQEKKKGSVQILTESSLPEGWAPSHKEMQSWEWIIGKTPDFTLEVNHLHYEIEEGKIVSCTDSLNEKRRFDMLIGHSLQHTKREKDEYPMLQELYRRLEE